MCEGCAYYIENWFYGYQVYCTQNTEYWLNMGGWIVLILIFLFGIYSFFCYVKYQGEQITNTVNQNKVKKND